MPHTIYSLISRGPVYFYPKSFGPGMTNEQITRVEIITSSGAKIVSDLSADWRIAIDPARVGSDFGLNVQVSNASGRSQTYTRSVRSARASQGERTPVSILLMGDSITNRGLGAAIREVLTASNYAPTFIGTMLGGRIRGRREAGTLGEGREGWAVTDFVRSVIDRDVTAVLSDDREMISRYVASTKSEQTRVNPFLRPAQAGDEENSVNNGFCFDFATYLRRFSLSAPDVVLIGLGSNDVSESRQRAPMYVKNGLRLMVRSIRKDSPKTKIGLWLPSIADTPAMRGRWPLHQAVVQSIIDLQRELNDDLVEVVPVWCQMDRDRGWFIAGIQNDGTPPPVTSDPIHPAPFGIEQMAEPLAAFTALAASRR